MKFTAKHALLIPVAVLGLGLAACQSKQEDAADKTAEGVAESSDAAADAIESQAADATGAAADKLNSKADAVRAEGKDEGAAIKENAEKAEKAK
jgi:hypothetical protein